MDYLAVAINLTNTHATRLTAPETLPNLLTAIPPVALDSLTISRDAMPYHWVARAVIADLAPSQMVAAILATEDEIRKSHPHASRTGWRASSDGLLLRVGAERGAVGAVRYGLGRPCPSRRIVAG